MKKKRFLSRLFGTMTIPAFASLAAVGMALAIFFMLLVIELTYRAIFLDVHISDLPNPPVVLVVEIIVALAGAAGSAYLAASKFRNSLERFNDFLMDARADGATDLESMQFAELRRLRAGVTRTVSKLRRENALLRETAFIDPRTGLANMIAIDKAISETLPQASFEAPAALIVLDLDRFSRASEQLGSYASEALLAQAGQRLKDELAGIAGPAGAALRDATLAALQADEFAVYMPTAGSREHVATIARAIRQAFAAPFELNGQTVSLGISGGIVMAPEDADSAQKLFRHAELALRLVREEATSGFRFFTPRLTRVARGKYKLEDELREAVANREFKAVFQPKVDFKTGKVVGAEALARWRRHNGKIISPAAFIPLAEETGLISQIGEQILEAACQSARVWMKEGLDVSVAVNVSPRQFERGNLTDTVMDVLKRTGLHPNRLELEITESMAVESPAKVAEVMGPLRMMGMKLAIDDFGTGHSNLSMLTQLPFDVFKIDRQFVSALEGDKQAPAIVEMILAMAETLGLQTVAEGVETERQADFLRRRGCTMGQGFLYSPGLPHGAFLDFLRAFRANPQPLDTRKVS
ncbi:putative bifunctional diguanylate cyclase/phosphodiesterase [Hyphomonas oceanitis]|uniref:putative bifunctional diguanylate cyclase/phosphodiesterase n=1 Tax=Hyphomonas oceanitis TaxID=81033 RepID=UPI003002EC82